MKVMLLWLTTTATWLKFWLDEGIRCCYVISGLLLALTIFRALCRRYFGHKRTIRPNAKRLYPLFLNRGNMSWDAFSSKVHMVQKGFMGEPKELRPGRGEFHENPSTCICERTDGKAVARAKSQDDQVLNSVADQGKGIGEPAVPNHTDEEAGEPDDDEDVPADKEVVDAEMVDDVLAGDPELEQILSD
jgi:hypothetical protein